MLYEVITDATIVISIGGVRFELDDPVKVGQGQVKLTEAFLNTSAVEVSVSVIRFQGNGLSQVGDRPVRVVLPNRITSYNVCYTKLLRLNNH